MEHTDIPIEKHPLPPFLPEGAHILMLGSFPPARKRWSMDFFYPNWINDMWRIIGLVFFDDKEHFVAENAEGRKEKRFARKICEGFADKAGIAMYDTACAVKRLKDNASDKFLEIVEATDLQDLLSRIPECGAIVATGQKAADVIVEMFGCDAPPVGGYTSCTFAHKTIRFWRMPSSSRAYPLPLEKKAEYYRKMFIKEGILK